MYQPKTKWFATHFAVTFFPDLKMAACLRPKIAISDKHISIGLDILTIIMLELAGAKISV